MLSKGSFWNPFVVGALSPGLVAPFERNSGIFRLSMTGKKILGTISQLQELLPLCLFYDEAFHRPFS